MRLDIDTPDGRNPPWAHGQDAIVLAGAVKKRGSLEGVLPASPFERGEASEETAVGKSRGT